MYRVLYVTTSLVNKGPTQQLYNIIGGLDRDRFKPILVVLSEGELNDRTSEFVDLDIEIIRLPVSPANLISNFFYFNKLVADLCADVIHSSGFIPDVVCAFIRSQIPWISSLRNDPWVDYPLKFGKIKGWVMALIHLTVTKRCNSPVACSQSLADVYEVHGINTKTIRNGTFIKDIRGNFSQTSKPDHYRHLIYAGSLIPRKNAELMVRLLSAPQLASTTKFIVLGDGPQMASCNELAAENVVFKGHVSDVLNHLYTVDYFFSLSTSEGMPNSVIEALASGLPCILSDIPSHAELKQLLPEAIVLIDLSLTFKSMLIQLEDAVTKLSGLDKREISKKAQQLLDSKSNSLRYQEMYVERILAS